MSPLRPLLPTHPRQPPTRRPRNRAPPPLHLPRLLRLTILDQQLALLTISIRQFLGHSYNIKRTCRLMENLIHFLERAVRRLRKEKVHARHHGGVDDGEDYIRPVPDVGEGGGSNHYDHEVEDPVCGSGNCVCGRADREGCYFGGVEPGHA